jgi:antitoxin CptB
MLANLCASAAHARLTALAIHAIRAALTEKTTMTGMTRSSEGLDARRRKLLFRSWHRGMREMDLILGTFADAEIDGLTEAEIDQYERLLDISDTELLPWITGELAIPEANHNGVLLRILAFRQTMNFKS